MPLALLPSPLLGPATWTPVAGRLRDAGEQVLVCPCAGPVRTAEDVLTGFASQLPAESVVLVAHSNAGAYLPALAAGRDVEAVIFVDAILPAGDPQPLAPPGALDFLAGLADADGLLPVWTDWWDDADVAALFADDATRRAVAAEQQRLPLSYFEDAVTVPAGWDDGLPAAYLAFGDTYSDERADAQRRGWPVRTVPGGHLHQVVDPGGVARELVDLLRRVRSNR